MIIDPAATPVANLTNADGNSGTSGLLGDTGKGTFLRLLVAQLSNQDPLNPQDPTQFISQLAQFSSLEQLLLMTESLTSIDESLSAAAAALPAGS